MTQSTLWDLVKVPDVETPPLAMRVVRRGLSWTEAEAVLARGGFVRTPNAGNGFYLYQSGQYIYGRFPGNPRGSTVYMTPADRERNDWEEVA